jgi:hypothetical protein
MSGRQVRYRLEGLEPDNLLAFLALLGLLRALETAREAWRPRAAWDLDAPPLRPILTLAEAVTREAVCSAAAQGVATLVGAIDFKGASDLALAPPEARNLLDGAALGRADPAGRYFADLCAALISDAALDRDRAKTAPTPLAYPKVARINFLQGLRALVVAALPEKKNRSHDSKYPKGEANCIAQALFEPWERLDRPAGLRWDPDEAKRHAYQWNAPTDEQPKTQHGANRLAIVGLASLTTAPVNVGGSVRLSVIGGADGRDGFSFAWPIWREPASLAAIRALLSHPELRQPGALDRLGVDHVRISRRISLERYRNFTHAEPIATRNRPSR